MIYAHQPGSQPIEIPETIPNPVVRPERKPAPQEPVKAPEKAPANHLTHSRGTAFRSEGHELRRAREQSKRDPMLRPAAFVHFS